MWWNPLRQTVTQRKAVSFARLNWRNDLAQRGYGPELLSGNSICLRGEVGPHLRQHGGGEGTIAHRRRGGRCWGREPTSHFYSFAGLITILPILHGKLAYDPVLDLPVITGTSDNFSSHWYGRRAQSRLVQWSR